MSIILDPAGTFRHPIKALRRWALLTVLAVLACDQATLLRAADPDEDTSGADPVPASGK